MALLSMSFRVSRNLALAEEPPLDTSSWRFTAPKQNEQPIYYDLNQDTKEVKQIAENHFAQVPSQDWLNTLTKQNEQPIYYDVNQCQHKVKDTYKKGLICRFFDFFIM